MDDRIEALERLASLRDRKVLSEAEYEIEKSRLLAGHAVGAPGDDLEVSDTGPAARHRWILGGLLAIVAIAGGVLFAANLSGGSSEQGETATSEPQAGNGAGHAGSPIRLSAILKFDNARECRPADELQTLIGDMRSLNPDDGPHSITVGVDGPAVRPNVQDAGDDGASAIVAQLVAPSTWQGLRVAEIRTTRFHDSDVESFQIRFKESPERVRRKLNDQGFDLPEPGSLATRERDDGHTLAIGIERIEGTTSLLCSNT